MRQQEQEGIAEPQILTPRILPACLARIPSVLNYRMTLWPYQETRSYSHQSANELITIPLFFKCKRLNGWAEPHTWRLGQWRGKRSRVLSTAFY
jgi:hypothetical protein